MSKKVLKIGCKENIFLHIENVYELQCVRHEWQRESHQDSIYVLK